MSHRKQALALLLALVVATVGCSKDTPAEVGRDAANETTTTPVGPTEVSGTVLVHAAASLATPFEAIAADLEAAHDIEVELNFAGSQQLVAQLEQGAPGDVLATADEESMDDAVAAGLVRGAPREFASNSLAIIVSRQSTRKVASITDLAKPNTKVALAAPEVPAGRYSREVFKRAGVKVTPSTEELSVKGVVSKVELGEVDAGVVYLTDARSAKNVEVVTIPSDVNVEAVYPVVQTRGAANPAAAALFLTELLGPGGRRHLEAAGFVVE